MQLTDSGLVLSPSDLNHFVECEHLTFLDLLATEGIGIAKEKDPQAEIIRAKGFEHEQAWLQHLRAEGRHIVEVASAGSPDWARDAARTVAAMRAGAEVIYQAVFVDGAWRGIADFLVRVDRPSPLGPWSYEACDAKLARHPKPYFILQLAWYTEQLARIQGVMPAHMQVVLGTGETIAFAPADFLAYYRAVRARFMRAIEQRQETYPLPVAHCGLCGYGSHCEARRDADDHLSLVAWMRRDQVERFEAAGVKTVTMLAAFDPATPTGITPQTQERLVRQARLQAAARSRGHHYELLPPEPKRGFGLLPAPSPGDIFFDIEGYPFFDRAGGLEYLWGVEHHESDAWRFRSFECVDRAGEKRAFEDFIDFVYERLAVDPGLHVYHYAAYETSAIKRLMRAVDRCAAQRIDSAGPIGTGLRYQPVQHTGNSQASAEEADVIAAEVRRLLDTGAFTGHAGARRRLTPADILVVAPYNMQVRMLLQALPAGVEAGTVDKFQGREAPVVFFSMASSSGEDIPRGVEFLFSRNRLNVAVSRAKAMAVLVCSPRLLETRCRTVEQMRLVNGLCSFVEHARAQAEAFA